MTTTVDDCQTDLHKIRFELESLAVLLLSLEEGSALSYVDARGIGYNLENVASRLAAIHDRLDPVREGRE